MNNKNGHNQKIPVKIQKYLERGEDEQLDYKNQISSEMKIAKTLVSFANQKGGVLLIGVNDNKTIEGINPEEEKFMLQKIISEYCKPHIDTEHREWSIGKKTILEVKIPEGSEKPYLALGEDQKFKAYIRQNDESVLASRVMFEVLKRSGSPRENIIRYSERERFLLSYLRENQSITLPEYSKKAGITRRQAKGVLVNLISTGIIKACNGEEESYQLDPDYN